MKESPKFSLKENVITYNFSGVITGIEKFKLKNLSNDKNIVIYMYFVYDEKKRKTKLFKESQLERSEEVWLK